MRGFISSRAFALASLSFASALALGGSCHSRPVECLVADQCDSYDWREPSCAPEEGRWECSDQICLSVCPECELAADCEGQPWDGPCEQVDGDWRCHEGFCRAACAGAECASVEDCTGAAWDLPCAGRWVCSSELCVGVCDYQSCGDGVCDPTIGEDAESCIPDCEDHCTAPIDCLGETWGEICQGNWSCNFLAGGVCEENCVAPSCGNGQCEPELGEGSRCPDCASLACPLGDGECGLLPVPPGCFGYWTCAWSTCLLVCPSVNVSALALPVSGPAPLEVGFSAEAEGNGAPFSFQWDFGQGDTSRLQNPTLIYGTPGDYTATVTVQDVTGTTALDSVQVTVAAP